MSVYLEVCVEPQTVSTPKEITTVPADIREEGSMPRQYPANVSFYSASKVKTNRWIDNRQF